MRIRWYLLLLLLLVLAGCKHSRKVSTCFYFWKTVYRQNPVESAYVKQLHCNTMYIRIMDVNMDDSGTHPVPASPIAFEQHLPDSVQLIPVVYIINNVLKTTNKATLTDMAGKIRYFVEGKVKQAGKTGYSELQIDCDWTADTRDNYFFLLNELKGQIKGKTLSVTLRLHQVKNQKSCGIPPVDKALLMCYNMGNLRKYGPQNSIIEVDELKKYLGDNIGRYPMPMDIALPLFSWAVVFRDKEYAGIARQINFNNLNDQSKFAHTMGNLYRAQTDLPQYGLLSGDQVRWEFATVKDLKAIAAYISPRLKEDRVGLVYFHLDENVLKGYTYEELENVADLLR